MHTKEARLARDGVITYADAARRVFRRREAFATAQPHSVLVLGYGTSYLYQSGVLCYIHGQHIRVLNVHDAVQTENVIHIPTLIGLAVYTDSAKHIGQLTFLNYCDRILACLYEVGDDGGKAWLVAIDIRPGPATRRRIRLALPLETTEKLFVRHNKKHLYYGTHSGTASHGHHEWIIKSFELHGPTEQPSLQLSNFVGSDLACTVAFEIHNDYFYALSNQTSFDVEEVDWTSYYHCLRFPLDKPQKECIQVNREIWRRQHIEGPINDSWTDLGMRVDERSGELLIVEGRREWQDGGSESLRTFYTQKIEFRLNDELEALKAEESSGDGIQSTSTSSCLQALPIDDPLTSTLDENSKPHWAPPRKRLKRDYHPERDPEEERCSTQNRIFTLAKTRYRTYNPCSSSFLDLVLDNRVSASIAPNCLLGHQIRLRIGSRKRAKLKRNEDTGHVIPEEQERFVDRGIRLWPPENTPTDLINILNPSLNTSEVEATSDERSLIYMAEFPPPSQERAIIFINFDSAIRFTGLPILNLKSSQGAIADGNICQYDVMLEPRRLDNCKGKQSVRPIAAIRPTCSGPIPAWFREEKAMYLEIGKGFQLR